MPASAPWFGSDRLRALADRVAVSRVAGAAASDEHDWQPLRQRWAGRTGSAGAEPEWWISYVRGDALDQRLDGSVVVQIVAVGRDVAGPGPWPAERPDDGRPLAIVRLRLQRLDDDGFVEGEWDGGRRVRLSLRLGSRATLRAHARRGDSDAWAVRLYRLLEVLRDWTPPSYHTSAASSEPAER
jgi:hypothetical protein